MCYVPNLRERTCRFGGLRYGRKKEEYCAFCRRTRSRVGEFRRGSKTTLTSNPRSRPTPCPALNRPGYVVVDPSLEFHSLWEPRPGMIAGMNKTGKVIWVQVLHQVPYTEVFPKRTNRRI